MSILQQEIDLYLNSGVSVLHYYKGNVAGTHFNVAWKRNDSYEVIRMSGKEFFGAVKKINGKYAQMNHHQYSAIWRNYFLLYMYNQAQRLAEEQDKEWILYVNGSFIFPQNRGFGLFPTTAKTLFDLADKTNGIFLTGVSW